MSYFQCDIPYMSDEELRENGIKIHKDTETTDMANADDLISRQAAIDAFEGELYSLSLFEKIQNLPSTQLKVIACGSGELNAESGIVRCKDCKHWSRESICDGFCSENCMRHDEDFYCGYAERRIDESD